MRKKIGNASRIMVLLALSISLLITSIIMEVKLTKEKENSLASMVSMLAQQVDFTTDLQTEAIRLASAGNGIRVTFISAYGKVLADSDITGDLPKENHLSRAEIKQAQVAGIGVDNRASETLGQRMIYAAAETPNGVFLRLAMPYDFFWYSFLMLLPAVMVAGVLVYFLLLPLSHYFAKKIVQPFVIYEYNLANKMPIEQNTQETYEEVQGFVAEVARLQRAVRKRDKKVEGESKKIETVLQNMREGFVLLGQEDRLLLINQAACQILQCSRNILGQNLIHATQNVALLDAVEKVKTTKTRQVVELQVANNWYEASVIMVQDVEGNGQDDIVIRLSSTTEKRNNARTRQEFFEAASHELKTPITSIRGFAELLTGEIPVEEEQKQECAMQIVKESLRMQSLIDDIIMISRLESGTVHFEKEQLDLQDIVLEYKEVAQRLGKEKNITVNCTTEPVLVRASKRQMDELIGNLVTNAVKYNIPDGTIEMRLYYNQNIPVFSIFNTGTAIPLTKTKRIFERFYRLDKGRGKAGGGTGLGLAIVKHVAGQYNAFVSVIPQPEEGNVFEIVFYGFEKPA